MMIISQGGTDKQNTRSHFEPLRWQLLMRHNHYLLNTPHLGTQESPESMAGKETN